MRNKGTRNLENRTHTDLHLLLWALPSVFGFNVHLIQRESVLA